MSLALPTRSENFGIAVAESLAAGIPVVVSRNTPWGVIEEVGAGHWLDLDAGVFAEHIVALLKDPARAREMGDRGRRLIETSYSWLGIAGKTLDCYQSILRARSRQKRDILVR